MGQDEGSGQHGSKPGADAEAEAELDALGEVPELASGQELRQALRRAPLICGGPLLFLLVTLWLRQAMLASGGQGAAGALGPGAPVAAGLACWMALWWLTEPVEVSVTALLPLLVLPLGGAGSVKQVSASFGHPLIFLFLGGFLIAIAMQRWGLHRRFALSVLSWVGHGRRGVLFGFMGVSALLSMWVSNTATVVMMLPIALSVLELMEGRPKVAGPEADPDPAAKPAQVAGTRSYYEEALLLGVAYAASIGGMATLIGSPPNLIAASFLEQKLGITFGFDRWMALGLPVVLVMLPVCALLLALRLPRTQQPEAESTIEDLGVLLEQARAKLGAWSRGERVTLVVFVLAAAAWILRPTLVAISVGGVTPFAGLSDAGIAMGAALLLFLSPSGGDPSRLPSLLVGRIRGVSSLLAPRVTGASPPEADNISSARGLRTRTEIILPASSGDPSRLPSLLVGRIRGVSSLLAPRVTGASPPEAGNTIPAMVLCWDDTKAVPWGTLLLFGGGLSLASALQRTGVTAALGQLAQGLAGLPGWLMVGAVVTAVIFLTELTSNTATTATLVPVLAGLAPGLGLLPTELVLPAALAASCAFMLPVATPPNAIVYGSGRLRATVMRSAGLWLNLAGILIITLLAQLLPH